MMYLTKEKCDVSLDVLELSVRADHCLKRAGFFTMGDLVRALADGLELKSIRNCGDRSIREIKEKMFLFQYYSLPAYRREDYLKEVVVLNMQPG
ncbi:MAG: hypothetical protein IK014_01290 [Lachnospiraceae bacterium]|nr:hypothetical protein [Lachnospiraceae bacterium]